MKSRYILVVLASFLMLVLWYPTSLRCEELQKEDKRIQNARWVLDEFLRSPDSPVIRKLLATSAGVAIFPRVLRAAFFVGGKYGTGILCARDPNSGTWNPPAFFRIGGGSFGFQFGGESIDLILLIRNRRGVESLLKGKVTLGADVSVAAGPVGRNVAANTDILLTAEIYSYSRTKGLFAGISLKGAVLTEDRGAERNYYGKPVTAAGILLRKEVEPRGEALKLLETLNRFSGP